MAVKILIKRKIKMDSMEQAVRLINVAKEAMPDSRAVSLLKNIIDPDLDLSLE